MKAAIEQVGHVLPDGVHAPLRRRLRRRRRSRSRPAASACRWCSRRRRAIRSARASSTPNPASSGGMLIDMGIHDFDLARWFMGDVQTVAAIGATIAYPELDHGRRHRQRDRQPDVHQRQARRRRSDAQRHLRLRHLDRDPRARRHDPHRLPARDADHGDDQGQRRVATTPCRISWSGSATPTPTQLQNFAQNVLQRSHAADHDRRRHGGAAGRRRRDASAGERQVGDRGRCHRRTRARCASRRGRRDQQRQEFRSLRDSGRRWADAAVRRRDLVRSGAFHAYPSAADAGESANLRSNVLVLRQSLRLDLELLLVAPELRHSSGRSSRDDLDRLNLVRPQPQRDRTVLDRDRRLTLFQQIHRERLGDRRIHPHRRARLIVVRVEQPDDGRCRGPRRASAR